MRSLLSCWIIGAFLGFCADRTAHAQKRYYGKFAGHLKTNAHGVRGAVFISDNRTIFIEGFHYDGQGPDAFFWGDTTEAPTPQGFVIPNENGSFDVLGQYSGQNLILTLPEGKSMKDIKSLSVWCRRFAVNFGSVVLPTDDLPTELSLGPLPTYAHGVRADDVAILDSKTLKITNLYYDGAGPDAFFLAGSGDKPHSSGIKIPDENGRLEKLRGYAGKDVVLRLPDGITVFDVDWMGLYCIQYKENFGHVMFPKHPNVPADLDDLMAASTEVHRMTQGRQIDTPASAMLKNERYFGKLIGELNTNVHDVAGKVYAASEDTFYITDFTYDGQGPDAFFWAGTTDKPSPQGFIVPDELGTRQVLSKYTGKDIAITLPDGKKISDVKWLSVWCRRFTVDFGHVMIPEGFQAPKEQVIGTLSSLGHGVKSGKVVLKDAKTIHISGLYYDGAGPDAFFLVGTGDSPHAEGTKVPDENGSLKKLHGYQGQDVMLRLPDSLTFFDLDWFALYCIAFEENFGHVTIPKDLNVPADLRMMRVDLVQGIEFDNCEELFPRVLHLKWKVLGQDLYMQMAGQVGDNEYLSFGRSGSDDGAAMVGADVAVAFYDSDAGTARVVDYYLSSKSQCSQGSGACPDMKLRGTDNVDLLSWERSDGIFQVNFKRPLASSDGQDLSIPIAIPVSVVAAIGPLNSLKEVAFHNHYYNKDAKMIHFGRDPPQDRCNPFSAATTTEKTKAWSRIFLAGYTTFRAQIGPTGGDRGYTAITGSQSWGIAWWMNGLLIPEITVHRGTNYTFIVEGGNDPSNTATYHPLYITNNPEGGGGHFLEELGTANHTVYAGLITDSEQRMIPIGVGRYCEWKHQTVDRSEESETFEEYKKTLRLECDEGRPGMFVWTPDEDTPDLVYYQCFTHRNLGWKIHVLDAQAKVAGAMEQHLEDEEPNASSILSSHIWIISVLLALHILS